MLGLVSGCFNFRVQKIIFVSGDHPYIHSILEFCEYPSFNDKWMNETKTCMNSIFNGYIFGFVSLFHDANRPIKRTLYFVHNICFHSMPATITNLYQTKHKHAHKHMLMRVFIVP